MCNKHNAMKAVTSPVRQPLFLLRAAQAVEQLSFLQL